MEETRHSRKLTPSAIKLLGWMNGRGYLNRKEITEQSKMSYRTISSALLFLLEAGRIERKPNFRDMRQAYFRSLEKEV